VEARRYGGIHDRIHRLGRHLDRKQLVISRRAWIAAGTAISGAIAILGLRRERENPLVVESVIYGSPNGEALLLDVYRPLAAGQSRPAVIAIHGGGFVGGSRRDAEVVDAARGLAEVGYVVFSIDYRLVDLGGLVPTWPALLDDAQLAVRRVRAHAADCGVDPERVGAYGISAGAGLAASLGVRETRVGGNAELGGVSSKVNCVVDLAGPAAGDVPPADAETAAIAAALFGGAYHEVPETYREASPLFHVDETAAPFLVVHGDRDPIVPVTHSRKLVAALREAGVAVEYAELAGAGHDVFGWDRVGELALDFFARYLHRGA
jgi:acetyl esterase/lipase